MEVSGRTEGFEDGMASESESIFLLMGENKVNGTALPINTEIDEIAKFL